MALTRPMPSAPTTQALATGLEKFIEGSDPRNRLLKETPHRLRVFSLTLESVVKSGIQDAKPKGWRFMVAPTSDEAVAAHVREAEGGVPKLTGVSEGPVVGRAVNVADLLETLVDAANNYEMRVLRVPGVPIEVFWLKADNGDDRVIPFVSLTAGL